MPIMLDAVQMEALLVMPKPLPSNYQRVLTLKQNPKQAYSKAEVKVEVDPEHVFFIKLRQTLQEPDNFSVIVGYVIPHTNRLFHLRRYNGRMEHRNKLEKTRFIDYHIHQATERYQLVEGSCVEGYAEQTALYSDIMGALQLALKECNFVLPAGTQLSMI